MRIRVTGIVEIAPSNEAFQLDEELLMWWSDGGKETNEVDSFLVEEDLKSAIEFDGVYRVENIFIEAYE